MSSISLNYEVLTGTRSQVRCVCTCVRTCIYDEVSCFLGSSMHLPTTSKDYLNIFPCSAILRNLMLFFSVSLIDPSNIYCLINKSRIQCHHVMLGILTFVIVVYVSQTMHLSFKWFKHWWRERKKSVCCELHGDKCFLFSLPGKMVAVFFTNRICNCVYIPSACLYFPLGFDFLRRLKHSGGGVGRGNAINFYRQTLSLFPRQIQCTFCWVIGIQEVTWSVLAKCEWAVFIMEWQRFGNSSHSMWEKVIKKTQWEIRVCWLSCRIWHSTQ